MKNLSIREARQALSHLDQLLSKETEVLITKHGKAVARITGVGKRISIPSHKDLREKMALMKKGSEKLLREDRDAR